MRALFFCMPCKTALFEFEFHFNVQIRHTHTHSLSNNNTTKIRHTHTHTLSNNKTTHIHTHTHTHRLSECDVMAKMFVPGTAVSIGATLLKLMTTDDMTSISSIASLLHQL